MNELDEWYNITVVGSAYEEQMHSSGRRRHRPFDLRNIERAPLEQPLGVGDWRDGPAPEPK
jgi:hypothetical protein